MRSELVPIGNSQGLRLPKALLRQCGITGPVEIAVEDGRLIITPAREPRAGWDEAFAGRTPGEEDDAVLAEAEGIINDWDVAEWEW